MALIVVLIMLWMDKNSGSALQKANRIHNHKFIKLPWAWTFALSIWLNNVKLVILSALKWQSWWNRWLWWFSSLNFKTLEPWVMKLMFSIVLSSSLFFRKVNLEDTALNHEAIQQLGELLQLIQTWKCLIFQTILRFHQLWVAIFSLCQRRGSTHGKKSLHQPAVSNWLVICPTMSSFKVTFCEF